MFGHVDAACVRPCCPGCNRLGGWGRVIQGGVSCCNVQRRCECGAALLHVDFRIGSSPLDGGETKHTACVLCDDLLNSITEMKAVRARPAHCQHVNDAASVMISAAPCGYVGSRAVCVMSSYPEVGDGVGIEVGVVGEGSIVIVSEAVFHLLGSGGGMQSSSGVTARDCVSMETCAAFGEGGGERTAQSLTAKCKRTAVPCFITAIPSLSCH